MTSGERERLLRLLGAHVPFDAREHADRDHILAFAASSPAPFDRRTLPGHLTGSAFILCGELILLTHHRKLDLWIQLGGHADGEQSAEAVAMREAREESGLPDLRFHPALLAPDASPRLLDLDVHRIPARRDEPAHDHLDLRFLLATDQPGAIRLDPRESRALSWVTLDEAARRGDPGMRRALAKIAALPGRTP